ncbi:TetR/AcrR family transcriptional regulator [Paenibacillus sp. YYML68]|uniref:TetR/AcrR family transcriptional regulator n=1 Tax=Paenibacillus sp. YYML68 TaxID=2909250 RepID=UPI002493C5FA|nr:TetR/AcrR family transcriptional regulator [Paenibacillus sp. YYML68]
MLRQLRKEELKERIFEQAVQLFHDKGYEQVTVQEIASQCGIAKGTFFNYYAKKEDILLDLGESQLELLEESVVRHQHVEHPKERVLLVLNDLLLRFADNSELMKLAAVEMIKSAYLTEKESRSVRQLHAQLSSLIDRSKEEGRLRSRWETDDIATTLVSVYFHTMMSWTLLSASGASISESLEKQLNVVWDGIDSI